MVFDPLHYLPLIERKIGALDQPWMVTSACPPSRRPICRSWPRSAAGRRARRQYGVFLHLWMIRRTGV